MRIGHLQGKVLAAGLALFAANACGGGQKPATQSGGDESSSGGGDEESSSGAKGVDPEAFDQLTRVFNNKRPAVGRCYSDAVQSGKLDKKTKGRLTVTVAIAGDGKAKGVKTTGDTLHSTDVEGCVVALIKTWDLPAPGDDTEFSFSYDFEPE
jgi:hypothetical protein